MADAVHDGRRLPLVVGRTLFDLADELTVMVPSSCQRSGRCGECVVQVLDGAEALGRRTAHEEFLPSGFRLACQATIAAGDRDVEFALLRRRLRILMPSEPAPDEEIELDPAVTRAGGSLRLDGEPVDPDRGGPLLGLAVDIGTTTVVFEVVDLEQGRSLHAAAFENPQRFGGSDVMSRISYEADHPGQLRRALRRALNRELEVAYRLLGVDRRSVWEAVVVGNPTMRDLFFGLDVAPLGRSPFRSVTEEAVRAGEASTTALARRAHEVGLLAHPRARVVGAPLIASHVGADAAADLVATRFDREPGVSLLVDIGTNTELVLAGHGRILAASSPAGPAFEGGGVRHGMAGADGAIETVVARDGAFAWRTVGDAPPEGICGSGLVDLLAESARVGLLAANTTLTGGRQAIEVVPERHIDLSRADVSALAQAKAANAAGQRILLRRLGLDATDVDRAFLAGAFANALDVGNAEAIGLLAPVPLDRVVRVGNASVRGAKALLLSRARRDDLDRLLARAEHVELEAEPDFFDLFVEGCRFEPLRAFG